MSSFDTSLLEAARTGDTATVRQLLQKGANVNAAMNGGFTPLMIASQNGHADVHRQQQLGVDAMTSPADLAGPGLSHQPEQSAGVGKQGRHARSAARRARMPMQ